MVNSVSFAAKTNIYDKPNLDAPQANQRPDNGPMANHPPKDEAPKKKSSHKALKVIAGLVAAAAVAVGAIAVGSKQGWLQPDKFKKIIPNKLMNWEKVASMKEPFKNGLASVEKFGNTVADGVMSAGTTVVNFFKNLMPKKSA